MPQAQALTITKDGSTPWTNPNFARRMQAFLQYYYGLFATNRAGLASLYQDQSMLTFEGQKFQGAQQIIGKLTSLPFQKCAVQPNSTDFQPSVSGGVLVFVTGQIKVGSSGARHRQPRPRPHAACRPRPC